MKLVVCAIFDSALRAYGNPFFVPSTGVAIRSFTDEINRSDTPQGNPLYHHPEDFELFQLSEYDDNTGRFAQSEPSLLARGKEVSLNPGG